jgi:O-antigen/teichoic acid export membrane protein
MSQRKVMARETAWSIADQGIGVVGQTISFFLLGSTLLSAGYGAYVGLFALIGPFLAFANSGVSLTILEHTLRDGEDRLTVIRSAMGVAAAAALIATPLVVAIAARFIDGISVRTVTLLTLSELLLNALLVAMVSSVMAHDGFIPAAQLRIMSSVVRIVVFLVLASLGMLNLNALAITQIVTISGVALVVASRVRTSLGAWPLPGRIHKQHVRSTFVYGTGIATSGVQNEGDKFVLNAANFQADAGRYGAAFRIVQMGLLPINSLVFATHISYLESGRANADLMRRSIRLGGLSLIYGVIVGVVLFFVAPIIPALLGDDFAQTETMIRWLAPVIVLRGVGTFPMNGLLGLGRNGLRTAIITSTSALSVILYLTLIPRHSWRGAIAGTLISETVLFLGGWVALYLCQRSRDRSLGHVAGSRWAAPNPFDRIA